jgi:ABC-type Fe3+/spermidine/putrescine transport system ATPase subunit
MSARIELRNVRKLFHGHSHSAYAVDGVDLTIGRGQFVTLLGSSGCGKTTTLRMIAGLEIPTSGQIFRDGVDITDFPATDREMRMVFQDFALFPNMTVRENVGFGLKLRRMKGRLPSVEVNRKVSEFLEIVHLTDHANKKPHQLSGGQKQRVALARALVTDPEVVLFDEPLGSLDASLRQAMQIELIRIHRQLGKTFIYVTHDQDEAMAMSDAIAVMKDGKVLQFGAPREIYGRPNCRYVATFVGHSNVVDGLIEDSSAGAMGVRLGNGQLVRVAGGAPVQAGQAVGVMLRADDLRLRATANGGLSGTVTDSLFRGNRMEYVVELAGGAGIVHVHHSAGDHIIENGRAVGLEIEPHKAHLLVN